MCLKFGLPWKQTDKEFGQKFSNLGPVYLFVVNPKFLIRLNFASLLSTELGNIFISKD